MTTEDCCNSNETVGRPGAATVILLEVATLLALAAFLAWSHFAGRLVYFLAPAYLWLPPAAAVVLGAMALARVVGMVRRRGPCACEVAHSSAGSQLLCALVLLGAVAVGGAVRPTQFSPEGMQKRRVPPVPRDPALERAIAWVLGERTDDAEQSGGAATALPNNPTVLDLVALAGQAPRESLEGQFVTLIGQAAARDGAADRFDLYRLVVTCCIADATAAAIEVVPPPNAKPAGGWVRVAGTIRFDDSAGPGAPLIRAASVQQIAEPNEPYLEPR